MLLIEALVVLDRALQVLVERRDAAFVVLVKRRLEAALQVLVERRDAAFVVLVKRRRLGIQDAGRETRI